MLHKEINENKLDKALKVFSHIYGELSLNPNIQERDNLLLADIGLALTALQQEFPALTASSENQKVYSGKDEILGFIANNKVTIAKVAVKLHHLKDDSTIEIEKKQIPIQTALEEFVNYIYKTPIEFKYADHESKKNPTVIQKLSILFYKKPTQSIFGDDVKQEADLIDDKYDSAKSFTLYKAKNGELAIRCSNKIIAAELLKTLGQGEIKENFRTNNPQFQKNPKGLTPIIYDNNPQCLYCSSYKAKKAEFAINLTSKDIRDRFIQVLGLVRDGEPKKLGNGQILTSYANGFFNTFDSGPEYTGPQQDSAIYFSPQNPIFNISGSFLKIQSKTLYQGVTDLPELSNAQLRLGAR